MIFGPNHYLPVLKVKNGEKAALQAIPATLCTGITPFLEIVARTDGKTLGKHIETAFKGLQAAVHLYPRCLIDTREIEPDGATAAKAVFQRASAEHMVFTPVTGISRTVDVAAALAHSSNGIAIRLTRKEFEAGTIPREIPRFMTIHGLAHTQVDLIIDLGPVDTMIQDGVDALASVFLDAVPEKRRWRTLTISCCAFPKSMSGVERDSHKRVERMEWRVWRSLYANREKIERLPTYSDCGIQHTSGVEGFNFRTMQASAAIRYTLQEDWLLIKGVGTRSKLASLQFPELAKRLVHGPFRRDFAGEPHCSGCAGVKAAADDAGRFGSPTVWRRLGTIHHITTVAQALAALP